MLSMPQHELCDIIVAMGEGRRIVCPGATREGSAYTYGLPIRIEPNIEHGTVRGVIVTLDNGVQTFLNPRWV